MRSIRSSSGIRTLHVVFATLLTLACGRDASGPSDDPGLEPTGPVTGTITPGGGAITAITPEGARMTVTIPAGAVRTATQVTVRPLAAEIGEWSRVALEPAGLVFRRPFTLAVTLPAGVAPADARLALGPAGTAVPLPTLVDHDRRSVQTTALAFFGFGEGGAIPGGGAFLRVGAGAASGNGVAVGPISCQAIVAAAQTEFEGFLALGLPEKAVAAALAAATALQADGCDAAQDWAQNAATVACDALTAAVQRSQSTQIAAYGEFHENGRALIGWLGIVQQIGPECEAAGDALAALGQDVGEFLQFFAGRLGAVAGSDYPAYQDLKDEAGMLLKLEALAYQLGLSEAGATVEAAALRPVVAAMRSTAYALCRSDGWHYPLSRLMPAGFFAARDIVGQPSPRPGPIWPAPNEYAGITAPDIIADLQYCGTDVTLEAIDTSGAVVASTRAGTDGGPGLWTGSVELDIPPTGTLRLGGELLGFTCWDGNAADREMVLALNGVPVWTLTRAGTGPYLADDPLDLSIETITQAAGITPAPGLSHDLLIRRVRSGCSEELWGPAAFDLVRATLNWTGWSYSADFEAGGVGAEWSVSTVETSPSGVRYLGELGDEAVTLSLQDIPVHTELTIELDLYVIGTWNGHAEPQFGIDAVTFEADGQSLLATTFSNFPGHEQAYPDDYGSGSHPPLTGAVATASLGYDDEDPLSTDDATYRLTFTVPHTAATLDLTVSATPSSGEETWGVDNVRVTAR